MSKFISNSFQVPNAFIDEILNKISGNACKIYLLIVRKTRGWNKESDKISYSQIQKYTGINHRATISKALDELLELGLIFVQKGNEKSMSEYRLNDDFCGSKNEPVKNCTSSKNEPTGSKNEQEAGSKNEHTEIHIFKNTNTKDKSEYDTHAHTHENQDFQTQKNHGEKQTTLDNSKSKKTNSSDKKSKSELTEFPDGHFIFTSNQLAKCQEHHFNIHELFDDFKNWHLSKGSKFKCWSSAFSTWISNQIKFERNKQSIQPTNRMNELRQMANTNPVTDVFIDDLPPQFYALGANHE